MFSINTYKKSDYPMIKSWWDSANEIAPKEDMLSEETTFVYGIDGVPAYSITLYLTNCNGMAYLEGFIKNPEFKNTHGHAQNIVDFACGFARNKGYKRVVALCNNAKLKRRYQELGMVPTIDNVMGFVQEL